MQNFVNDETGAVTVDWVVLTAALVGLGLAVMAVTSGGVENLSNDTAMELASIDPGSSTFGALSRAFDFSSYSRVSTVYNDGNWANHQTFLNGLSDADLAVNLGQHQAAASDPGLDAVNASVSVDGYAYAYGTAQARGILQ